MVIAVEFGNDTEGTCQASMTPSNESNAVPTRKRFIVCPNGTILLITYGLVVITSLLMIKFTRTDSVFITGTLLAAWTMSHALYICSLPQSQTIVLLLAIRIWGSAFLAVWYFIGGCYAAVFASQDQQDPHGITVAVFFMLSAIAFFVNGVAAMLNILLIEN